MWRLTAVSDSRLVESLAQDGGVYIRDYLESWKESEARHPFFIHSLCVYTVQKTHTFESPHISSRELDRKLTSPLLDVTVSVHHLVVSKQIPRVEPHWALRCCPPSQHPALYGWPRSSPYRWPDQPALCDVTPVSVYTVNATRCRLENVLFKCANKHWSCRPLGNRLSSNTLLPSMPQRSSLSSPAASGQGCHHTTNWGSYLRVSIKRFRGEDARRFESKS